MLRIILSFFFLIQISLPLHSDSLYFNIPDIIGEESLPAWLEDAIELPIDLNQATGEDLRIFPFLSDDQINALINTRPFSNKKDIRRLLGDETYRLFRSYFIIAKPKPQFRWEVISRMAVPIQRNLGLTSGKYQGSSFDSYSRLRCSLGSTFSAGILLQKDVGEQLLYDHTAGFIEFSLFDKRLHVIGGSFLVYAGQGLILSSPFAVQKSTDVTSSLNSRNSFCRPYLSAGETNGFLGIYSGFHIPGKYAFAAFYSRITRDAILTSDNRIKNSALSGLHRTEQENHGRDVLQETSAGVVAEVNLFRDGMLGIAYLKSDYDPALAPYYTSDDDQERRKNYYQFSGNQITAASAFFRVQVSNLSLFGEIAANPHKCAAVHTGFLYSRETTRFGLRWWQLPTDFKSPFGRTFSSQTAFPAGEQGFFLSFSNEISKFLTLGFYWETENKLWRTFYIPIPVNEKNISAQINYSSGPRTNLNARLTWQQKPLFLETPIRLSVKNILRTRLQLEQNFSTRLRIRWRVESSLIAEPQVKEPEHGFSAFQELRWHFIPICMLTFRFTTFNTDGYDSRLYEAEHDLGGRASLAAFSGSGQRWYILLNINLAKTIEVSLKYRRIHFDGAEFIGTGQDRINSDMKEEIKFQLRFSG